MMVNNFKFVTNPYQACLNVAFFISGTVFEYRVLFKDDEFCVEFEAFRNVKIDNGDGVGSLITGFGSVNNTSIFCSIFHLILKCKIRSRSNFPSKSNYHI